MNSDQSRKWLKILLMVIGLGLMVATIPIFFPATFMATIHQWLGLGEFPNRPITLYLARSTSLLYAVHGFLIFCIALRMDHYQALVPIIGWLHVAIGLFMLGIDLSSPMPWYWTAFEGIPIAIAGLVIVGLYRSAYGSHDDSPTKSESD